MAITLRREEAGGFINQHRSTSAVDATRTPSVMSGSAIDLVRQEVLGNSYRRARTRGSRARDNRDLKA